ncbi:MAG: hypothetical protein JOZ39_11880 [Chloroflexi bacterium]|nr:hypothetical protein [Chloroflexota bacterium]
MPEGSSQAELYQLAEDFIRLQMRLANAGLKLLPRESRAHALIALREAFEGARATTRHFGSLIDRELEELSHEAAEPATPPARKVRIVRDSA